MAAVRQLLAKGVYRHTIATKKWNKCHNNAVLGLLPKTLSWYVQNGQNYRAKRIIGALSLGVTGVPSRECYPTVNTVICADEKFAELNREVGLDANTTPLYSCSPVINSTAARKDLTFTPLTRCRVFLSNQEMHTLCHRQHSLPLAARYVLGQYVPVRAYSVNEGRFEPLFKSKTGYYDILQVAPNATRAQIKTAYYKQSFIYHPDKNAGSEEATIRFSDISEAYNVLGNKGLKKKYDQGLLTRSDLVGSAQPSARDTTTPKKHPTRTSRQVMGSVDGKKNYDFDAYIKHHYGVQLQRDREMRERIKARLELKEAHASGWKLGKTTDLSVWCIVAIGLAILYNIKRG